MNFCSDIPEFLIFIFVFNIKALCKKAVEFEKKKISANSALH